MFAFKRIFITIDLIRKAQIFTAVIHRKSQTEKEKKINIKNEQKQKTEKRNKARDRKK
jgi:hypothetical protein